MLLAQGARTRAIVNRPLEERLLSASMRVVDPRQQQTQSLEQQATVLEIAQRGCDSGRGLSAGAASENTAVAALNSGSNHKVDPHPTVEGSAIASLTPDAPNFVPGMRLPYTFRRLTTLGSSCVNHHI
jgi:hypothetical protein